MAYGSVTNSNLEKDKQTELKAMRRRQQMFGTTTTGDLSKMMSEVTTSSSESKTVEGYKYVSVDLIDEHPDNKKVFNMKEIERLANDMKENGFDNASPIAVIKKPDGRYEISGGHRRFEAAKMCGYKEVLVYEKKDVDDIKRAKLLLGTNILNRVLTPMDYARAIEYYIANVLKPEGFKGDTRKACAEYFGKGTGTIYRYQSLLKLIPELQELADEPDFPFSAFEQVTSSSEEIQKNLYETIMEEKREYEGQSEQKYSLSKTRLLQMIDSVKRKEQYRQRTENQQIENEVIVEKKDVPSDNSNTIVNESIVDDDVSAVAETQEQKNDNICISTNDYAGNYGSDYQEENEVTLDSLISILSGQINVIKSEEYTITDGQSVKMEIDNIISELTQIRNKI